MVLDSLPLEWGGEGRAQSVDVFLLYEGLVVAPLLPALTLLWGSAEP